LPSIDFTDERVAIGQAPIHALAIKNANFDFRHVQPTGVLRGVVEYHTSQQFVRSLDSEHLLETFAEMRIEVVEYEMNPARPRIDLFEQMLNEGHEVRLGAMIGDLHDPSPAFGFDRHEQVAGRQPYVAGDYSSQSGGQLRIKFRRAGEEIDAGLENQRCICGSVQTFNDPENGISPFPEKTANLVDVGPAKTLEHQQLDPLRSKQFVCAGKDPLLKPFNINLHHQRLTRHTENPVQRVDGNTNGILPPSATNRLVVE
jgi:hypothetical protein